MLKQRLASDFTNYGDRINEALLKRPAALLFSVLVFSYIISLPLISDALPDWFYIISGLIIGLGVTAAVLAFLFGVYLVIGKIVLRRQS